MDLENTSFDDLMKSLPLQGVEVESEEEKQTLVQKLASERVEWTAKIEDMSKKMKKVFELNELMTTVYTERQRAVEYYYYLLSLLIKINKTYRKNYAQKYDYYSYQSQKRFPNERNKELIIYAELSEIIEKREMLDVHSKFMLDTKNSIDNIIYGIKYRIDIEKIKNGSI